MPLATNPRPWRGVCVLVITPQKRAFRWQICRHSLTWLWLTDSFTEAWTLAACRHRQMVVLRFSGTVRVHCPICISLLPCHPPANFLCLAWLPGENCHFCRAEGLAIRCARVTFFIFVVHLETSYYPRESEEICFTGVGFCVSVCVSVCLWPR